MKTSTISPAASPLTAPSAYTAEAIGWLMVLAVAAAMATWIGGALLWRARTDRQARSAILLSGFGLVVLAVELGIAATLR